MTRLLHDCGCVGCGCVTNDYLMFVRHECVLGYLCLLWATCACACARLLVLVLDTGRLSQGASHRAPLTLVLDTGLLSLCTGDASQLSLSFSLSL
jgi:hypothetical protein